MAQGQNADGGEDDEGKSSSSSPSTQLSVKKVVTTSAKSASLKQKKTISTCAATVKLNPESPPFVPSNQSGIESSSEPKSKTTIKAVQQKPDKKLTERKERKPVKKPNNLSGLLTEGKLKNELNQLQRLYSKTFKIQKRDEDKNNDLILVSFDFPITDPDFPFDLNALSLTLSIPKTYPDDGHVGFEVRNENVPEAVRRRIHNRMEVASEGMPKGELNIKPLLRLLERNLEKWMIALPTIAPSDSIKIFNANEIKVSAPAPKVVKEEPIHTSIPLTIPARSTVSSVIDEVAKSLEMSMVGVPLKKEMAHLSRYQPPEHVRIEPVSEGAKAGTIKITLKELKMENIGLAVITMLNIALKCARCQHSTPVSMSRLDVDRIVPCSHCKQYMEFSYLREALHSNNQSIGYIRCKRTIPIDLLGCTYQITCAACSPEDPLAGSIKIENVLVGEEVDLSCRYCHENVLFGYESVSWSDVAPLAISSNSSSSVKPSLLPTKIGEPLPKNGTCSHYGKSTRWFRFPCCGRAYPCDRCHDEDNPNHRSEWANRQVCGFCSREFSTSQKHCLCGESPGEIGKKSAHWEGGKGTRDQTLMSKKDRKKYRNLEKTIPRSAAK